ncbi:MAG TPA: alpha/beta fold hydrolase [Acetobacteraceae bacterium]|nr:alpha/beta fold hydrolase [Acetobacteraceae bacterium]
MRRRSAWGPCLAALVLAGCAIPKPGSFYTQPVPAGAKPGTLISYQPFGHPPRNAQAFRILYVSTDQNNAAVPVSAVVYIPTAQAPYEGRNIVAWAHPTTGVAEGCAPSLDNETIGGLAFAQSIPGLDHFLSAGDIVTATDYQGLGAPGVHPYLIGALEGDDILDSIRAARQLPGAHASRNVALWGHSQGGQAVLYAGQIAHDYAPRLHLVGIAAAAPPTDFPDLLTEPFKSNGGRLLAAYIYDTWSQIYHVDVTSIVAPPAVPVMRKAAAKCINALGEIIVAEHAASRLNPVFLDHEPASTPPWPHLFSENSPGNAPPGAPLLIVQSKADKTVPAHYTDEFVNQACTRHESVNYLKLSDVSHMFTGYKSADQVAAWIAARFVNTQTPNTCP